MKILFYDCFAGISGDMNLAALINIGVPTDYLTKELQKLNVSGYEIQFSEAQRRGITGTQVNVLLEHEHHHHETAEHADLHHHEHRNLHDIEHIINHSQLSDKVKGMSKDIFRLVAQAEAKIHGKPLDEVHFHEVGAVDSIVDIVGAAICIDYLKPDRIIASPVEMGGGFVHCAHGVFPVPAPATLEIMQNKPMKFGAVPFEAATPTGVAILAALADEFTETAAFTVTKTGYGIGHRDTGDIPNVLRVCLGTTGDRKMSVTTVEAVILECNIDDMNPEHYPFVMQKLFAAGADDVFLQNIIMKKSRPAVLLSVLCSPDKTPEMENILFTETTTLGLRSHSVQKKMLDRNIETLDTPWGTVRVKKAFMNGKELKCKAEYDDCEAIARANGIELEHVCQFIQNRIKTDE
ncbi:MAG: nickel pincer cofactor biosynthesis protein LarC [Bacteroidales bacterium]|jgi:uncharacterized protein (TIGR00299 family) protein|nr:nickel pincer cofactor biosynthesis protein LarC [Bacteroidales bacterium]